MARRTIEEWNTIRCLYEAGVMSVRALAAKVGTSHTAINKKADAEGWVNPRSPPSVTAAIAFATTEEMEQAVDQSARRRVLGVQSIDPAQALENAVDERAHVILCHRDDWSAIATLKAEAKRILTDPAWRPPNWNPGKGPPDMFDRAEHAKELFKVYDLASKALVFGQEGERRAHGFSFQMQQKQDQQGAHTVERRKQLIDQIRAALAPRTAGEGSASGEPQGALKSRP
jgi:hypothetical protein